MAVLAAAVVTVEIDAQMFQLASEELIDCPNVTMLRTDALRNKNRLSPAVLEAVAGRLQEAPGRRWKLVANLPYNIATPLISNLLALDSPPQTMTVTIQRELAERIVAPAGAKDYGALSVWVQSQCQVRIVRLLPAAVFWPRPQVESAFLHVALDPQLRGRIADRKFFHEFVRAMFFHRRKLLRSELLSAFKHRLDKPGVDRLLAEQGFDPTVRAERLDVAALLRLCDAVRAAVGG
jgi:16S rRNA (adenine1518-N6/adenine1519-N6)-dimethyltransferase